MSAEYVGKDFAMHVDLSIDKNLIFKNIENI
jgi:hypothetical protein